PNAGALPGGGPAGRATGGQPGGGTGTGNLLDGVTTDADAVAALTADADSFTWVAAAVGSQNAASLQLATGEPVMAIGGFNGSDPSPTLAGFQQLVSDGQVHYFLEGSGFRGQQGGSSASTEIGTWVAQSFRQVEIGGQTFYDLTQPVTGPAS
ncbi:MAG: glycosyl transferase, partial [Ornithinibacter sp.]